MIHKSWRAFKASSITANLKKSDVVHRLCIVHEFWFDLWRLPTYGDRDKTKHEICDKMSKKFISFWLRCIILNSLSSRAAKFRHKELFQWRATGMRRNVKRKSFFCAGQKRISPPRSFHALFALWEMLTRSVFKSFDSIVLKLKSFNRKKEVIRY